MKLCLYVSNKNCGFNLTKQINNVVNYVAMLVFTHYITFVLWYCIIMYYTCVHIYIL